MSDFLKYWDTRIIRNQRVFDAHPQIANFAYCECEKVWGHMESENKALRARLAEVEAQRESLFLKFGCLLGFVRWVANQHFANGLSKAMIIKKAGEALAKLEAHNGK